jgi:hypothetical protein
VGKKAASLKKGKTQATKQKGFKVIISLDYPPANAANAIDPIVPTYGTSSSPISRKPPNLTFPINSTDPTVPSDEFEFNSYEWHHF